LALLLMVIGFPFLSYLFAFYFVLLFIDALLKTKNIGVSLMALFATIVQFVGYGIGFLKSTIYITFSKRSAEEIFPKLFFKNN